VESARRTSTDLRTRLANLPRGHPSEASYSWDRAKAAFAEAWQRHQERWPRSEQKADRKEPRTAIERQLADGCDKIQAAEKEITGKLRAIEAQQPGRTLIGLDFRLKGRDRLIEKTMQAIAGKPGRSPEATLALMPDAVRYTFAYEARDYAIGVRRDTDRLRAAGFEMIKLKNYWSDPEYKGINSQWRDGSTGQRFEVQFHTSISFEAKQVTHDAYERLRTGDVSDDEEAALEAFQRKVTARVPLPLGALDITEHS